MACRIRSGFSTRAMRTYPSPLCPNPAPGDTQTFASSSNLVANYIEDMFLYACGIGAQTNIDARGDGTGQPIRFNPSISTSLRSW